MNSARYSFEQKGFTLVELVIVIVVLGIVSVYVAMKGFSAADVTLPSQAQKMATDLRHAQTLAITWGKGVAVCASNTATDCVVGSSCTNGFYSVSCATSSTSAPCNSVALAVCLEKGVTFSSVPVTSLVFNSLGQPNGSSGYTYTLNSGISTNDVSVAAITGRVTP